MAQYEEELSEIIVYISGLRRTFNRKLDDHLFIIEQQRERIEFQQHLIDEQRSIVDELAWQIRDLRDSVRQCCEKMSTFESNHSENCNSDDSILTNHRGHFIRQIQMAEDNEEIDDCAYETVDSAAATTMKPTAAQRTRAPKLERQSAVDRGSPSGFDQAAVRGNRDDDNGKRQTRYVRPAPSIPLALPPLPTTSPPHTPRASTNSLPPVPPRVPPSAPHTSFDDQHQSALPLPQAISSSTSTGLAQGPPQLTKQDNVDLRDSIDEYNEELGDIIYRLRQFKDFSRRSNRGSSKNVCSMISDIEGDYLPRDSVDGDPDDIDQPDAELTRQDTVVLNTNTEALRDIKQ